MQCLGLFAKKNTTTIFEQGAFLLFIAIIVCFQPGCANIIPPTGGLKDSLPPTLIKATPTAGSLRFNSKTIQLEFDEYVTLETDGSQPLLVNPPLKKNSNFQSNLRTVTIKFNDTLQANTTYQIRFGDAIQDVNERNPYRDFTYVFSTGDYIDSMQIAGTITNAESGLPDSTLMIFLHRSEADSAVAKKQPDYVAYPNGRGEFLFTNLPNQSFYVFAMKNEGTLQYNSPATPFAFYGEPVKALPQPQKLVELYSFVVEKDSKKPQESREPSGRKNEKEEKNTNPILTVSPTSKQDILLPLVIKFTQPIKLFDSSKFWLTDTLGKTIARGPFTWDSTQKVLSVTPNWVANTPYRLIYQRGFVTDTLNHMNTRTDTVFFSTKAETEYGSVRINFGGLDINQRMVLQLFENNQLFSSYPLLASQLQIPLVKPGNYQIRILYDKNGNGQWDTGNYWLRLQPEQAVSLLETITIRQNWENEFEINF